MYTRIRHSLLWIGLAIALMVICRPISVWAQNINFTVQYQQSSARDMLGQVNALRTGGNGWYWNESNSAKVNTGVLKALTYDYELEKMAMVRAAELAVYYSHTRPDGTSALDAYTGHVKGENIAYGYTTTNAMFLGWLEENEPYSGQGHRRNMLDGRMAAIGIGHIIYDGTDFWAMELRSEVASPNTSTPANNTVSQVTVNARESFLAGLSLSTSVSSSLTMLMRDTTTLTPGLYLRGNASNGWQGRFPITASYSVTSSNPSIVEVSGMSLTARGEGSATLTVTASNPTYGSVTEKISVTAERIQMDRYVSVTLSQTEYTWSGAPVCPIPAVTYKGNTLHEGIDYRLSYVRNNKCTRNTGGATVSAIGLGDFTGFKSVGFEILAADISTLSPRLAQTTFSYDGYTKEPQVIIGDLQEDTDFHVEYSNNRNPGTATARVVGWNNYTGLVNLTFTITGSINQNSGQSSGGGSSGSSSSGNGSSGSSSSANSAAGSSSGDYWSWWLSYIYPSQSVNVSLSKPTITYAVNNKKKKITVQWTTQSIADGYEVQYKTGKTKTIVKVKGTFKYKKVLSKLKKGKTYTITVRAYRKSGNGTIYSSWSNKKKVKIKK